MSIRFLCTAPQVTVTLLNYLSISIKLNKTKNTFEMKCFYWTSIDNLDNSKIYAVSLYLFLSGTHAMSKRLMITKILYKGCSKRYLQYFLTLLVPLGERQSFGNRLGFVGKKNGDVFQLLQPPKLSAIKGSLW
jgi:hypothetical protein